MTSEALTDPTTTTINFRIFLETLSIYGDRANHVNPLIARKFATKLVLIHYLKFILYVRYMNLELDIIFYIESHICDITFEWQFSWNIHVWLKDKYLTWDKFQPTTISTVLLSRYLHKGKETTANCSENLMRGRLPRAIRKPRLIRGATKGPRFAHRCAGGITAFTTENVLNFLLTYL